MNFSKAIICFACFGSLLLCGCKSVPNPSISQPNITTSTSQSSTNPSTSTSVSSSKSQDATSSSITSSTSEKIAVAGIELDKTSLDMVIGENATLTAIISPSDAFYTSVTWESSDSSIASVAYYTGIVRARKEGIATITAKTMDGGFTATCEVTVKAIHITSFSLDKESIVLKERETYELTPIIEPENASNKEIVWSSSDTDVATAVYGTIYANHHGEATITATTEDGGFVASCHVSVKGRMVTNVKINKSEIQIEEEETYELYASIEPYDAGDKTVTWSSDNNSVATVDSEGKVAGIAVGEATITAQANYGEASASCKVVVTEKSVWQYSLGRTKATIYTYTPSYNSNPESYIRIVTPVTNTGNRNIRCQECTYDIEDSNGNVLQSVDSIYCKPNVLKPGETGYYYKEINNSESVEEGAIITAHPTIKKACDADCVRYEVSKVSFKNDDTYGLKTLGKVKNTSNEALSMTEIVINVFDENDVFLTALSTILYKTVEPSASISFEATSSYMSRHRDITADHVGRYEAFAYKWQLIF